MTVCLLGTRYISIETNKLSLTVKELSEIISLAERNSVNIHEIAPFV